MIILGLDLSLTGTGMCVVESNAGDGKGLLATINTTAKTRTEDRLISIRRTIAQASNGADAAIIEGLSYGSVGGAQAERSALHWNVEAKNDNEADAAALAHLGLVYYGQAEHQTIAQQEVIYKLRKERGR